MSSSSLPQDGQCQLIVPFSYTHSIYGVSSLPGSICHSMLTGCFNNFFAEKHWLRGGIP
jgi:hypothetical protein